MFRMTPDKSILMNGQEFQFLCQPEIQKSLSLVVQLVMGLCLRCYIIIFWGFMIVSLINSIG